MSTRWPTGTRGRLTALVILLLPLLLLGRFLLAPAWQTYSGIGERSAESRDLIERYQGLARRLTLLEGQAARLAEDRPLAPYLVEGQNRALTAANLQRKLQQDARRHKGRILSARVIKAAVDGPFERVTVDVRVQLPLEGLQALLHELETGRPYLFIDNLNITARPPNRRTGDAPDMDVRMTLFGLRAATPAEDDDA